MEKMMICPTCGHEMDMTQVASMPRAGMRVRALRQAADLNTHDFCVKARISSNTLCSLELRNVLPSMGSAIRMAKALGVPLDVLFNEADDEEDEEEA